VRRTLAQLHGTVLTYVGPYRRWYGNRLMDQGLAIMERAAEQRIAAEPDTTEALAANLDYAMGQFRYEIGKVMADD
jgi:hypothetical protein